MREFVGPNFTVSRALQAISKNLESLLRTLLRSVQLHDPLGVHPILEPLREP